MLLKDFIKMHYKNKAVFARAIDESPQLVSKWVSSGHCVLNHGDFKNIDNLIIYKVVRKSKLKSKG